MEQDIKASPEPAIRLLGCLSTEIENLSIHARNFRSPLADETRVLIEALFLLTLGQDFIMNIRSDGKITLYDM